MNGASNAHADTWLPKAKVKVVSKICKFTGNQKVREQD